MKKRLGPGIFGVLLALHLAAQINQIPWLLYASKALLVPALIFWLLHSTARNTDTIKLFALSALLFSWGGDVLLIFVRLNESFFLAGLCAFLIAQVFYLYTFRRIALGQRLPVRLLLLVPVTLFWTLLYYFLFPSLGDYRLPVFIYGTVITMMLFFALQLGFSPKYNRLIAGGAALFILSDMFLAWNKFRNPFTGADSLIMLSYGIAQYFICGGIIGFLHEQEFPESIEPAKKS